MRRAVAGATMAVAAVVVGLLAACSGPAPVATSPAATPVATSPVPASVASSPTPVPVATSPGPSGPSAGSAIPDSAFLQPADTDGGDHGLRDRPAEMLPPLCGATYPSDASISERRAMHVVYWTPGKRELGYTPAGAFEQTITVYRSGGASRFLAQLRAAVAACPVQDIAGHPHRHRLLGPPRRGDDALLIETTYPTLAGGEPTGTVDIRLVSVVRLGDVVLVLHEQGWEAGWSADRAVVDSFTGKAVARLRSWLG